MIPAQRKGGASKKGPLRREKSDVALDYSLTFAPTLFYRTCSQNCNKGGVVNAPNSYVFFLARILDQDRRVQSFRHQNERFEYWHPTLLRVDSSYFDFDVRCTDGSRRLLFVTPQSRLHTPPLDAMLEGAECAARALKAKFEVWTEMEIFGPNPEYMRSVIWYIMDKIYLKFGKDDETDA
jgi:hypothetical protein